MKTFRIIGAIMLVSLFSLGNVYAQATKTTVKKTHTKVANEDSGEATGMNSYFVSAVHAPDQCMQVLDEIKAKGEKNLSKFYFGCGSDDHTAYAIVKAASADEARNMLPLSLQTNAKVVKVESYNAKQLDKMHKEGMPMQKEGMQKEGMQKQGMQKEGMQKEGMQKEGMQKEGMQKQGMPKDKSMQKVKTDSLK